MSSNFIDVFNKCRKPTVAILREALEERASFSISESNFVTYMAGFSHYEFAAELFDEFGLKFLDNTSILFDNLNKKFHIKVLITDQFNLGILSPQILETYQLTEFSSSIPWRNSDGSYIDRVYDEVKNLNRSQYDEYKSERVIGSKEEVLSYEADEKEISFVIHFITIWRNIDVNLNSVFDKVSIGLFVNHYDDKPNLAIQKLRDKKDIHYLLAKIKWYVLDIEEPEKFTSLFNEIGAEYTVLSYKGEDYNHFQYLISNVQTFMMQYCNNL